MTEKSVQEWIDEAGEEPTAFGRAVIKIGKDRGFPLLAEDSSVLELEERDALALRDHIDGVDHRDEDGRDFVKSVALALGLDPDAAADYYECRELAATHLFGDKWNKFEERPGA